MADAVAGGWTAVPKTRNRKYITGLEALNIRDYKFPWSGDWHQGVWEDPNGQGFVARTNEEIPRGAEIAEAVGGLGLRDARKALREIGHPAGWGSDKVWCAGHARAMVELEWEALHEAMRNGEDFLENRHFDEMEAERILSWPEQYVEMHRIAEKLDALLATNGIEQWRKWRGSLGPRGSRYDGTAWKPGRAARLWWTVQSRVEAKIRKLI